MGQKRLCFLIVLYVSLCRWVHFTRAVLFCQPTSSCSLDHGSKALVFLIVLYVLSYRWVELFCFVNLTSSCLLMPTGFVAEVWTYSLPLLVVMLGSCRNSVWSLWLCKVTTLSVLCSLMCHSDVFMYRVSFLLSLFGRGYGGLFVFFFPLFLYVCSFFVCVNVF